jgi:hypothetical protein
MYEIIRGKIPALNGRSIPVTGDASAPVASPAKLRER